MIWAVVAAAAALAGPTAIPLSVRPELVEGLPSSLGAVEENASASTSSARTEGGTALDAERAFDAMAAAKGQWTAFRAFAAPNAVMFAPQPVNAQAWPKDRKDPPASVRWQPTASYVSCDGSVTVNTGAWQRPNGSKGFFTTVWKRQADGSWKWVFDDGDALKLPRRVPAVPGTVRASCLPTAPFDGQGKGAQAGDGRSADGSVIWEWAINSTGHTLVFDAYFWNGKRYDGFEDLMGLE